MEHEDSKLEDMLQTLAEAEEKLKADASAVDDSEYFIDTCTMAALSNTLTSGGGSTLTSLTSGGGGILTSFSGWGFGGNITASTGYYSSGTVSSGTISAAAPKFLSYEVVDDRCVIEIDSDLPVVIKTKAGEVNLDHLVAMMARLDELVCVVEAMNADDESFPSLLTAYRHFRVVEAIARSTPREDGE